MIKDLVAKLQQESRSETSQDGFCKKNQEQNSKAIFAFRVTVRLPSLQTEATALMFRRSVLAPSGTLSLPR